MASRRSLRQPERAPWESDVSFSLTTDQRGSNTTLPSHQEEIDTETKAFVEEIIDNWDQRKGKTVTKEDQNAKTSSSSLYSLENVKRDYRLKKQKIHAGLWVKEIEKQEEAKLGNFVSGGDDIEKLLDSCSEIFDSALTDLGNSQIPSSELKNKPDGWETTSKTPDGNLWDLSQREEDILVQEFERRIAFNKFQIASFIKTHIFSRRRPIDGWKYMIEEIGPNSRKGKGNVSRLPSVLDESTQPFREEKVNFVTSYSEIIPQYFVLVALLKMFYRLAYFDAIRHAEEIKKHSMQMTSDEVVLLLTLSVSLTANETWKNDVIFKEPHILLYNARFINRPEEQ